MQEMSMQPKFISTLSGYATYKGGQGLYVFLLHRITGLGTLLFLSLHILTTASVYFFPSVYNRFIEVFRWPPVMVAEIILVFCVIYHGTNGLRIAYLDLFKPELWEARRSNKAVVTTLVVAILLWLPAAAVMSYNLLKYGFGLF
jgi:succinate dehydrogenase / fumarate reductase cytochrome b subunit